MVELRCMLLLPLDDLLAVTREFFNPDVSRSGLVALGSGSLAFGLEPMAPDGSICAGEPFTPLVQAQWRTGEQSQCLAAQDTCRTTQDVQDLRARFRACGREISGQQMADETTRPISAPLGECSHSPAPLAGRMSQRVKANPGPQRRQTRLARHHFDSARRKPFRASDYFSGLLSSQWSQIRSAAPASRSNGNSFSTAPNRIASHGMP